MADAPIEIPPDDADTVVITAPATSSGFSPWIWVVLAGGGIYWYTQHHRKAARRHNPELRPTDWLMIGGIAAGAYLIYKLLSQVPKIPDALKNLTAPVAQKIANVWTSLTLGPSQSGVLGDVILPDGTDAGPLSGMQVRMDSDGNVYVNVSGAIYQLGQSDPNGNWPATAALMPNFGVTAGGW